MVFSGDLGARTPSEHPGLPAGIPWRISGCVVELTQAFESSGIGQQAQWQVDFDAVSAHPVRASRSRPNPRWPPPATIQRGDPLSAIAPHLREIRQVEHEAVETPIGRSSATSKAEGKNRQRIEDHFAWRDAGKNPAADERIVEVEAISCSVGATSGSSVCRRTSIWTNFLGVGERKTSPDSL